MSILDIQVPRKLQPLLSPARYKGAHGGRGGSKSHFFAEQVVLQVHTKAKRAVCIREIQESIKDSVKTLIEAKIKKLGLSRYFDVTLTEIRALNAAGQPTGGLIVFRGMQSFNAENIKSLEGFDIAWVEEAQTLSARSLELLRPTIRKSDSELWFSWNPRFDTDAVDDLLRGGNRPKDAVVVEINWNENPWFPEVLKDEKDRDYAADPEMASHVWGGGYQIVSEGAYYARLVAQAEREGRIGFYPYNPQQRLRTAWDLGVDDYMACWFIQDDGVWSTAVDYYEMNGVGFDQFVANCMPEVFIPPLVDADFIGWSKEKALDELGRDVPFKYNLHFLPHDIAVREIGAGARHRHQSLEALGVKPLKKGVQADPEIRIAAGRQLLPSMRFHNTSRVQHGLKRLMRYRRRFNELLGIYMGPLKDGNDHGADAFGEYAVNCDLLPSQSVIKQKAQPTHEVLTGTPDGRVISNVSVLQLFEMQERLERMRELE